MRSLALLTAIATRLPSRSAAHLAAAWLGRLARRTYRVEGVVFDVGALERWLESYERVSRLPTIASGLQALGMSSPLDWFSRQARIAGRATRYTHPDLRPHFFYPGVEARRFYDSDSFTWARRLEQASPAIRDEVLRVLTNRRGFQPMMSYEGPEYQHADDSGRPPDDPTGAAWNSFFFVRPGGAAVMENQVRCPETWRIVGEAPRLVRGHTIMFSAMEPGMTLRPHVGAFNHVLRVLLGVLVSEPERAFIRVGGQVRHFEQDRALLLNDGFVHGAANRGHRSRVVLFFDVWHPDFEDEEISVLEEHDTLLMQALGGLVRAYEQRAERDARAGGEAPGTGRPPTESVGATAEVPGPTEGAGVDPAR